MLVVGVDPGRSRHTGLFALPETGALRSVEPQWRLVPMSRGPEATFKAVILPVLQDWCRGDAVVIGAEQAPKTARKATGHGPQGQIGDAVGYVGGLAIGAVLALGGDTVGRMSPDMTPTGWRALMFAELAEIGLHLARPEVPERTGGKDPRNPTRGKPRMAPGGGYAMPYDGCDHELPCADLQQLRAAPPHCPTCNRPLTDKERADFVSLGWKRIACTAVQALWPATFQAILDDAWSRSREHRDPAQTAGVPDVCEAAGVCIATRRMWRLRGT